MLPAQVVTRLGFALVALTGLATAARGGLIVIPQPTAAYEASTTKFAVPNSGPPIQSLVAGGLTITFSGPMTPGQAGPGHFGWANPPFVEDSAPAVLFSQRQSSRVLTFSEPLETFGLEMLPNNSTIFSPFTLTAQFYDGTTLLGTISQGLRSPGGARLFAATDTDFPITSVQLSAVSAAGGFDVADIRAAVVIAEPSSLALVVLGLAGTLGYGWRRRGAPSLVAALLRPGQAKPSR